MDRNVFAMIAATVFLLTMIIATIQMQLSMIEKAAEEVEKDFGAYSYPIAGSMYLLNPGGAAGNSNKFGYLEEAEFKNRLDTSPSSGCILEKTSSNIPIPGFGSDGPLKVKSVESFDTSCGSFSSLYTDLTLTVMRKESGNIHSESVEVSQNLFTASGLLGR